MAQPALPATAQSGFGAGASRSRRKTLWVPALICILLLGMEIYALVHDIGAGDAGDRTGGAPIATFESGKNQVRQKTAGTIIWNSPTPGQTLFRQDAIATMPGSQATVRFADHSEMIVEADSLIVFEDASFAKDGAGGKIIARLVRGSVRRKNSGPMDLFVKFSRNPGDSHPEVYRLSDPKGGAIFRVTYQSEGIEVTVESGGLHVAADTGSGRDVAEKQTLMIRNGAVTVVPTARLAAPAKLPSPVLKKPTIKIRKITASSVTGGFLGACENFLGITAAWASEPRWRIEIHFAWDAVPGARSYLIQISRDPSFQDRIVETVVDATLYNYRTVPPKNPENLYMRVAGVDDQGNVGDFSPLERIHIRSLSQISGESHESVGTKGTEIAVVPVRAKKKRPRKSAKRHFQRPPVPRLPKSIRPQRAYRIEASYGAIYQSRTFKGDSLPSSVSSSGFVPLLLRAEYVDSRFRAGGSYLFEIANPGGSGTLLQNGKLGVPVFRGWGLLEKPCFKGPLSGWTCGIGPYLTDSSRLTWSGSSLTAQLQLLLGVLASAIKDTKSLQWRAELGIVGLGGLGADTSVTARRWLFGEHDYFAEAGAQLRLMSIETSYGGTLAFGMSF